MHTHPIFEKMNENLNKWITFLNKMDERLNDFCTPAVEELLQAYDEDTDEYKRAYLHLQSGIVGQVRSMTSKAREIYKANIESLCYESEAIFDILDSEAYDLTHKFRSNAYDMLCDFENRAEAWVNELKATEKRDPEKKYKEILEEYEQIKDKFCCKQCGSQILIPKLFFITTYLTCPYCQTQNTFEPSNQAKQLEHLARELAEHRTKHLLIKHEQELEKERFIYAKMHQLKLELMHTDYNLKPEDNAQIVELTKERQDSIKKASILYEEYIRTMYDEWSKIVPEMKEHNDRICENRLKESRR